MGGNGFMYLYIWLEIFGGGEVELIKKMMLGI